MSLRELWLRFVCALLRHDPAPLATVSHIGMPCGPQVKTGARGSACQRCGALLEDEESG